MKRILCTTGLAFLLVSCDNNGGTTEQKLDSLGEKLENAAENTWDSTKEKAKELKDRIENRLDRRDSAERNNDTINKQN